MLLVKKIFCPIDFSEHSLKALDLACELAQNLDAELRVLYVVTFTLPFITDAVCFATADLFASEREIYNESLNEVNDIIASRVPTGVIARGEVKIGSAVQEIICAARDEQADMIVMGTHGASGWHHLCLGSVTEKVVRKAPCPVLTARSEKGEEQNVMMNQNVSPELLFAA